MTTPIYDFVTHYTASGTSRLHMPGHKGHGPLSIEARDITEIEGADVLSEARGIIGESEANASSLFRTGMTVYSTEGSSLCVRAMLYLILQRYLLRSVSGSTSSAPATGSSRPAPVSGSSRSISATGSGQSAPLPPEDPAAPRRRPVILAARNTHKSFLYACAMLDFDVEWVYPEASEKNSICACHPEPRQIAQALRSMAEPPAAVYLTSPDYLGTTADIRGIVDAADAVFGEGTVPVIVDNAHGAYLHFLREPRHPMDLGAYLCCDSAHKTLPCLTGGAYLHLSRRAAEEVGSAARQAVELFGTTSPSYLILQSLDLCNRYLAEGYPEKLSACITRVEDLKEELRHLGIRVMPSEPLKLVIDASPESGEALASAFRAHGIEPEFADVHYLVCMFTPENSASDFERVAAVFRDRSAAGGALGGKIEPKTSGSAGPLGICPPLPLTPLPRALSIREAVLSPQERIGIRECAGRICGQPSVSCPPAIPIAVSGEVLDASLIPVFEAYGIREISVVKAEPARGR